MYERALARIRSCILSGDYFLTLHAEEEMAADALSGVIVGRQRDKTGYKYVIVG